MCRLSWYPAPGAARRSRIGWVDLLVLAAVLILLMGIVRLGSGMAAPLSAASHISLSPWNLPLYAGESLLRIVIAFLFSLVFAIAYGYAAAKTRLGQRLLVPLLDILQSVPVLGFLSATVAFFAGLFPGSTVGLEIASVFAIFTAQAWNMAFSFYHTEMTLSRDLQEASQVYRLGRWQRLWYLELPSSAISLILNSMMSFGGSWFFLAASENVTYAGRSYLLPGVGSYMAVAEQRGDVGAMVAAVFVMIVLIVAVDQIFWRPVVAWSQRFKMEQTRSLDEPSSFVLTILQRSVLVSLLERKVLRPTLEAALATLSRPRRRRRTQRLGQGTLGSFAGLVAVAVLTWAAFAGAHLLHGIDLAVVLHVFWLGILTFLRVAAAVLLGALWAVPAGVYIGLSPRVSSWAQPVAQIAASFPANMLFPVVVAILLRLHTGLNIGAVPLMMLGTQWYILFNVMAGTIAIPSDLKEAARVFGLRGGLRWRQLILPAIFPSLVTGGVTAAGGAWNASIVAEVASWGGRQVTAQGVGAYITLATAHGRFGEILLGIAVMSLLVVATNRLIWRPLYRLAETKYHID
ncbi:MAG: ABC transporter permease subunit [Thermaerobacter sp.]|nr:ABC transporter permease subunit [Thermaerobacter sp.]